MRSRDGKYTLHKAPSGAWRLRFFDENGKRQSRSVRTVAERDALSRAIRRGDPLNRWFPDSVEENAGKPGNFGHLAREFIKNRRDVKEISESCLSNYETQLRLHILPVIGGISLDLIHVRDLEQLAVHLKKTKAKTKSYASVRKELFGDDEFLSSAYRREILTLVCAIAKFGLERDYISRQPFKAFQMPDATEKPYDYWRPEEEEMFLSWLEDGGFYYIPHTNRQGETYSRKWKVWNSHLVWEIVMMALRTGMRKGEIAALTMDNVNFDDNLITVRASYSEKERKYKDTTKNKGYRRIEMNDDVRNILWGYRHLDPRKRVFKTNTHTLRKFSQLTRYAGVREIHFHALRHTFLTNIANGIGMDEPVHILKVKELAGHANIETTMLYVHNEGVANTSSLQWSRSRRKEVYGKNL